MDEWKGLDRKYTDYVALIYAIKIEVYPIVRSVFPFLRVIAVNRVYFS